LNIVALDRAGGKLVPGVVDALDQRVAGAVVMQGTGIGDGQQRDTDRQEHPVHIDGHGQRVIR
jgi:hypothetical protein